MYQTGSYLARHSPFRLALAPDFISQSQDSFLEVTLQIGDNARTGKPRPSGSIG